MLVKNWSQVKGDKSYRMCSMCSTISHVFMSLTADSEQNIDGGISSKRSESQSLWSLSARNKSIQMDFGTL